MSLVADAKIRTTLLMAELGLTDEHSRQEIEARFQHALNEAYDHGWSIGRLGMPVYPIKHSARTTLKVEVAVWRWQIVDVGVFPGTPEKVLMQGTESDEARATRAGREAIETAEKGLLP